MKTKLLSFISNKNASYIEPERRGTPKGDPIGLSSVKYKSTLLYMTNLKGKEIADAVGVSHGLLRLWRTEDPYLQAIERHVQHFAGEVINHIISIMESTKTKGRDGKDVYFVVGKKINDQLAKDFADIPLYSDDLMAEIYKQAKAAIFDDNAERTFLSYLGFIFALRKGYELPLTGTRISGKSPVVKQRQKGLTAFDFIEALQKPWNPDQEKVKQAKSSFLKEI